jgi:hypothetical protein
MKRLTLCFLWLFPLTSFALTCEMLRFNLDDARTQLRRAVNETNLKMLKITPAKLNQHWKMRPWGRWTVDV